MITDEQLCTILEMVEHGCSLRKAIHNTTGLILDEKLQAWLILNGHHTAYKDSKNKNNV